MAKAKAKKSDETPRNFADHGFKVIFGHRQLLRQFLDAALPMLSPHLDCDNAIPQETPFGRIGHPARETDTLWLIPWRDDLQAAPVLVIVLIEHQSRPDRLMTVRIIRYISEVWTRLEREHLQARSINQAEAEAEAEAVAEAEPDDSFRLPPALPIVFYTGQEKWSAPQSLKELIDPPKMLEEHQLDFRPIYWQVREHELTELQASESALLNALAVVRAEGIEYKDFHEHSFRH